MNKRHVLLLLCCLILTLILTCGVWLRVVGLQYARNRELIAALVHNERKLAFNLVNAGADPNTRYEASPSLKQLLDQLTMFWHSSGKPINDSPTAFMLVCGADWSQPVQFFGNTLNSKENVLLARAMLAHDADCKLKDVNYRSALYYAVSRDYRSTAQLLLLHGARINELDVNCGRTRLIEAVMNGETEMTRLLLDHGADVSVVDKQGHTALDYAVRYTLDEDIVRQLLAHDADPNRPDRDGDTPLKIAQDYRPDFVDLLKRGKK